MWIMVALAGCKGNDSKPAPSSGSAVASTGSFLTVGAYCTAFCDKLCATCGVGDCQTSCNKRCHFGRAPELVLDGKDPKTALALTQHELDACLATITADSCMSIASGQVPPACYTIQH
jgi:hypothetical protein